MSAMRPVIIRGFLGQKVIFEDRDVLDDEDIPRRVQRYRDALLVGRIDKLEAEIIGELDEHRRFAKFGLSPAGRVVRR